ncbi:hypothetical protein OIU84_009379 [Salix udensis]|uniref:Uncharacterized protein n=1 Tax=Salix udensis TaxID=889485 RepID=A0AAD6JTC3_9ROSI|nr:hypothetical protein OIU84_009379 [Salix udensis]
MKAATPQGELPSDGCWYVLRRLSHGVMLKSQPTMAIITTGTSKMSQFTCVSAVSAMSLWFKYQGLASLLSLFPGMEMITEVVFIAEKLCYGLSRAIDLSCVGLSEPLMCADLMGLTTG